MDCAEGTGDLDEDIARFRVLNADSDFFHDAIEAVPSLLGFCHMKMAKPSAPMKGEDAIQRSWNSAILLATGEPSGLGLSTLGG